MLIYAISFHIGLTMEKIIRTTVITKIDRPPKTAWFTKCFLLDAKEKPNIQKCVEFHALSFYPSESEI